jgi:hypothetical protein
MYNFNKNIMTILIIKDIQREYNNTRLYISINDDILVDKCYINDKIYHV